MGQGYMASIISARKDLLPEVNEDGWYHLTFKGRAAQGQVAPARAGSFQLLHRVVPPLARVHTGGT